MRGATYARVSTEDQTRETQFAELGQHVQALGWAVYGEYIDAGVSGATRVRPTRQRLLVNAGWGRFGVVLVWRLDRLGRDLADLMKTVGQLDEPKVGFKSLCEHMLDTSSPGAVFIFTVFGALAQFERAQISKCTRAGMVRAEAAGMRMGAPKLDVDLDLAAELVQRIGWKHTAKKLRVRSSASQRRLSGTGTRAEDPRSQRRRAGLARDYHGKRQKGSLLTDS